MLRVSLIALLFASIASAQGPTYGLGRAATEADQSALGAAVTPDGGGLPAGKGTAAEGSRVYESKCRECHGVEGKGDQQTGFVGTLADITAEKPKKTVGSYWPHATTLWDYTNRAMPFKQPGTLATDEVYAVTAYILYLNGLIGENDVLDEKTLPAVKMPNREGFISDQRPDVRP